MYRTIIGVLMTACIGILCVSATSGFQDVLDTPAVKSPLAEKCLLNGIVLAGKRLVSVGQYGNILYSDDKGKSWIQAAVPVSSDLVAVNFPTPQKGWAVGHDGIVMHSADGGATWIKQLDGRAAAQVMLKYYTEHPPRDLPGGAEAREQFMADVKSFVTEGPDKPFLDVFFENETSGFIVGAFNLIFHTADGGKTWEPWFDRTENPGLLHMYSIRYIGEDIFIAGEQGLVLKLDRKASRFRKIKTPYPGTFFGITGKSGVLIAFGMRGNIVRSADKGASWNKIETGVQVGLTGATVTEDGRIILVSQGGDVLVSKDDCRGFNRVKVDIPFPAAAVAAADSDTVVLAGFGGLRVQKLK
ncbi:MAG: YCF48-related protein [Dehalococcoidia bacterium]